MKSVLTIAGSDPSGGAGIQSDLRTFVALGVAGLSAITSITAQNSDGVSGVFPVETKNLSAQLAAVAETRPDAVKIGMLGTADHVAAVASVIERRGLTNVVLDTVLASTGGVSLLDVAGRNLLVTTLLPLCDLVTPNISEASALTGIAVTDQASMLAAADKLLSMGAKAVLVKGGHLEGEPIDWLFRRNVLPIEFQGHRIHTQDTHGTGCLLSSAIAAFLAHGESLPASVASAKLFLSEALRTPVKIGIGRGYPYPASLPHLSGSKTSDRTHQDRIDRLHGIYVVTDPHLQRGRSMEEVTLAALKGGAQIIQLRDKTQDIPQLVATARRMREIVHRYDKLFIVNDRIDVALASDADGVHLGPDDMAPADACRLLGPDKLVGVSTGTVAEAIAAAPFASYLGVGCIFGTMTKHDAGDPVGPSRVTEIKSAVPGVPTVAIGGITSHNFAQIVLAGATSAALVSAIVAADDIEYTTHRFVTLFSQLSQRNLTSDPSLRDHLLLNIPIDDTFTST